MTTVRELILSFFESSKERLRNPAISAFIFAWAAVNWRIILILLLSGTTIEERIRLIEECYIDFVFNFWIPLSIALFYLLLLPYFMALFDWLSAWAITFRKSISHKHRISDLSARQEVASEERQLELIKEGSPDVAKLKDQIVKLENERDELLRTLAEQGKDDEVASNLKIILADDADVKKAKPKPTRKKGSVKKTSKSTVSKAKTAILPSSSDYPAMRDNVIRNVAKSEKEWILLYGFYSSNFGKKEFTREDLIAAYDETKRKTDSRHKNLSNNINTLVKQGLIRYLNDDEMLLTDPGISLAKEVLNR